MLTLLTPSALLALAGLLVPVAIHLWNRRPGREVAVGSLRWLAAGANRRLRNLKLEQWWLLLLRATVLGALAVALAGPAWRQALPAGRGQVLLSPEVLGTPALATLQPTLDSLRRRGYALRQLAPGFPPLRGADWRPDSLALAQGDGLRNQPAAGPRPADWQWERVRQAAGTFPGQPLYVVTPAALRGFQGPHPPLAARVTWQTLPVGAPATWLQAAALRADTLHLLLGRGTETQTAFRRVRVVRPRPGEAVRVAGLAPLRLEKGANGWQLTPVGAASATGGRPVPVRTQPLRVLVYATAAYAPDARFLRAGLRAAAVGLPVPLALNTTSVAPSPDATAVPDWLFWLSDTPLPAAWSPALRAGLQVWQEAGSPGQPDEARLVTPAAELPVAVFRRATARQPRAKADWPIWTDGVGRPVLSRQTVGRGAVYQLHTRLNPAWSELGDSPALPAELLALLEPEPTGATAANAPNPPPTTPDQRSLDPAQLAAVSAAPAAPAVPAAPALAAAGNAAPSAFRLTSLRPWLVLAAGVLFALERLLAYRRKTLSPTSAL